MPTWLGAIAAFITAMVAYLAFAYDASWYPFSNEGPVSPILQTIQTPTPALTPSAPPTPTNAPIATPSTAAPDLQATIAAAVEATIVALPTPTPAPTPTPVPTTETVEPPATPTEAPTPIPKVGDVLYEADWSDGMNGWAGSSDWKYVPGMLVSDGSFGYPQEQWITAPYLPETPDYAIEAQIQLLNPVCGVTYKQFGLIARAEEEQGSILGGVNCGEAAIAVTNDFTFYLSTITSQPFDPRDEWHTYRLEVKNNTIKLFVDGGLLLDATDNRNLSNGRVGLFSIGAQINVRSFKVIQL